MRAVAMHPAHRGVERELFAQLPHQAGQLAVGARLAGGMLVGQLHHRMHGPLLRAFHDQPVELAPMMFAVTLARHVQVHRAPVEALRCDRRALAAVAVIAVIAGQQGRTFHRQADARSAILEAALPKHVLQGKLGVVQAGAVGRTGAVDAGLDAAFRDELGIGAEAEIEDCERQRAQPAAVLAQVAAAQFELEHALAGDCRIGPVEGTHG
ncbi:conserved hypothetical protein, partial [Ricinus communis]